MHRVTHDVAINILASQPFLCLHVLHRNDESQSVVSVGNAYPYHAATTELGAMPANDVFGFAE